MKPERFLSHKLRAYDSGFSLIEALIGAALISVIALGLGAAVNHLQQSREKSQSVSFAIETESAIVNALQDPASYASVAQALHDGKPPDNFQLQVVMDSSTGKSFSVGPNQKVYLNDNLQSCSGFSDKSCTLMVALSRWGKDIPIPGQYSFGYSIQSNPSVSNMAPLGSSDSNFASPSDFVLTVPSLANTGKLVQCAANAVGILGVDSAGQALCLYYSDNKSNCQADEIPKGFKVTPDAGDPHRYYLSFNCVAIRKIGCGKTDYSFENFNPTALDPSVKSSYTTGKCVYIEKQNSNPINVSGTDGVAVTQMCATNYIVASPVCTIGAITPTNVTCSDGHVITANTSGLTTSVTNAAASLSCQAAIPQQQCCADDPTKCSKISVNLNMKYTCTLDASHSDETVY